MNDRVARLSIDFVDLFGVAVYLADGNPSKYEEVVADRHQTEISIGRYRGVATSSSTAGLWAGVNYLTVTRVPERWSARIDNTNPTLGWTLEIAFWGTVVSIAMITLTLLHKTALRRHSARPAKVVRPDPIEIVAGSEPITSRRVVGPLRVQPRKPLRGVGGVISL